MKFSRCLQIGIVGGCFLTPAMAQEAQTAQEEALRLLRGEGEVSRQPAALATPESKESFEEELRRHRNEREALLRAQVAVADAARRERLAERRTQWETAVLERERVRSAQRQHEMKVAEEVGLVKTSHSAGDANADALRMLRSASAEAPAPQAAAAPEMAEAEVPPTQMAALETPQPAPLAVEAPEPVAESVPVQLAQADPGYDAYMRQLEQRAAEMARSQSGATAPATPAQVDPGAKALEVLRQQADKTPNMPVMPQSPSAVSGPDAEAKARAALREYMSAHAYEAAPHVMTPKPVDSSTVTYSKELEEKALQTIQSNRATTTLTAPNTSDADVAAAQARALEALRSAPPPPTPQVAPAIQPVVTLPPAMPAAAAAALETPTPRATAPAKEAVDADLAAAHAKALEALRGTALPATPASADLAPAMPAAASPQPPAQPAAVVISSGKSKREKLTELNELYKQDKVTPADYHQMRAKILAEP